MCYHAPMLKKALFLALILLSAADAHAASLRDTFGRRASAVAVAVTEPVNNSEDKELQASDLKKALEEKLAARREPKFSVVADPAAAEITVSADIKESIFLEHDPVDKLIGIGGTAWDAATVEHYARLVAVYTVTDVKSGRVLWTDKLMGTVTDKTMTKEESRPKIVARAAEIFIREAFGKKQQR